MSALLIIAGTDSSGGAGLTRDVAAATEMANTWPVLSGQTLNLRPVVTAVTVQTDQALQQIHPIPVEAIRDQIQAAVDTGPIGAVKIGMVGSAAATLAIARALETLLPNTCPVVLDPVLRSSSGGQLMSPLDLAPLLVRVDLITPNIPEASKLCPVRSDDGQPELVTYARQLQDTGVGAVLIKGGHGTGAMSVDHLFQGRGHVAFERPRLPQSKRGTGCSLATAIAVQLMGGETLETACIRAGDFVHNWLKEAVA
ncbi:bifunctional hydroxymethylpyrimidine kinase/phosphomethylpyrimidine kinase [Phaeobacter sp. C3_T13_0]|uniref:bifunctional hydroxymethylpyrimidine kinase/phosphomethylpyrimidine kinase n=1 Tax=Phaeobacter cretensis TaxID=3342641 RepID=UPI0039BCBAD3